MRLAAASHPAGSTTAPLTPPPLPPFHPAAAPITKKSKHASIPADLQAQWAKDRTKKADRKRERAEARLAALLDPYSSNSNKSRNKAKKSKQPHATAWTSVEGELDFDSDDDDDDGPLPIGTITKGGKNDRSGITNMVALDEEIQRFLRDHGKTTMSLPPMEKESRKRVHELADCYSLKSASKGAGRKRFTTLIKTSRSGLHPNRKKVGRILRLESSSYFAQASWSAKSGSGNHTMPGSRGGAGAGRDLAKRREGEVVGEGAKQLDQDNLGHKLLSKMGWSEGMRIGHGEGGLAAPCVSPCLCPPARCGQTADLVHSLSFSSQSHGRRQEQQVRSRRRLERPCARGVLAFLLADRCTLSRNDPQDENGAHERGRCTRRGRAGGAKSREAEPGREGEGYVQGVGRPVGRRREV